jgi:regulatory protein
MTGAPQDGDRGRRVVQLRELLEASGPGAPDRVADLGSADRAADEHAVADLFGAGRTGAEPDRAGVARAGVARAGVEGAGVEGSGVEGSGAEDADTEDPGAEDLGAEGTDRRGASSPPAESGNRDAAVAVLDGLRVGRDAAPVAGLDGTGLGGTAAAGRTVDLGAAGARKRRRAPGSDSDPDLGGAGSGRVRRGAGRRPASDRRSGPGRIDAAEPAAGPAPAADPDGGGPAEPTAAAGPRGRWGSRGAATLGPDVDPVAAARDICLRLLTDRARTRHELAQALRQKGVPDDAAEQVLSRFDEVGLIDDAAFAGQWVRSRHRSRGLGRRAIAQELRRKGVDAEIAGEALAEVDGAAEEQRARELVDRKLRSMRVDSPADRVVAARRLVGMLARKGYGGGLAYGVVRTALAEHGADTEEFDGGEPAGED